MNERQGTEIVTVCGRCGPAEARVDGWTLRGTNPVCGQLWGLAHLIEKECGVLYSVSQPWRILLC
jgi:hypothetical protein